MTGGCGSPGASQRHRADPGSDAGGPGADTAPLPGDDEDQACPGLPVHARDVRRRGGVPRLPDVLPGLGEWFGPGGARPRNDGSDGLPVKAGHVVVSRPGQVVALDTTVLPVKVREGMFGDPVSVHGMALPRDPRRGRRRVRRIRARRAAVLHPGDRHHRSRVGLQKPPAPGSAESPGLQRSPRPHAAPSGQGRLRAGVRGVQAAAVREAARLRRRRRRRLRCRPGT